MSVHQYIACDEPTCAASFPGSRAAAHAAGWVCTDGTKRRDRCPACHARIGVNRGRRNPSARLSDADVIEIRRRVLMDGEEQRAVAKRYGLGPTQVHRIVRRENWAHVEGPVEVGISEDRVREMLELARNGAGVMA